MISSNQQTLHAVTDRIQTLDTEDKLHLEPRSKRGMWVLLLVLLILIAAAEFYVLTATRQSGSPVRQTPLAEAGLSFIQSTLRTSAASPVFPAVAILVAFVLGGLHALAPGHNKILTGAYLVGSGGRIRHSILIGGATAFSHTASVIVIGLLALSAPGQAIATLYLRWLGVPSGLLIAGMGVWLLMRHLRANTHGHPDQTAHGHDHSHGHPHDHPHHHSAGSDRLTLGALVGLGLMHGIIPTADALAVLLVALSVKRAILGLALILSYSVGIAGVLSAVGMVFVTSQGLLARFSRFGALARRVPAIGAVIVIVFGLTIIARTLVM